MCSVQEMQRVDRGLSSELVKSPINPAFLFMSVPLLDGYNPLFYVQLNGEALWEWRSLRLRNPSQLFETLQDNLSRIAGSPLALALAPPCTAGCSTSPRSYVTLRLPAITVKH